MNIQLTEEQKRVVEKTGKYVVRAVPGSGKTMTVAYKVIHLLQNWGYKNQGIAVLSFTNVAWKEIDRYLKSEDVKLSYPHFLGTIDSFINRHIFKPFIKSFVSLEYGVKIDSVEMYGQPYNEFVSLEYGVKIDSVEMYGQPYNEFDPIKNGFPWGNSECYKCDIRTISYDINGNLIDFKAKSHFNRCPVIPKHKFCENLKMQLILKGMFTQNDANYFSLKIITKFPSIANALTERFPVFIIDEAQDTSEIQMAIIDKLVEAGLQEIALIGDPDQAIFEWRDARPELFIKKMNEWGTEDLSGCWRSSQKICDFYNGISSAPRIIAVNDEIKDLPVSPQIWGYTNEDHLKKLIEEDFISNCKSQNIEITPENVAVVFRSSSLINEVMGLLTDRKPKNPWKLSDRQDDANALLLAKAKMLRQSGDSKQSLNLAEKALCGLYIKKSYTCMIKDFKEIYKREDIVNFRLRCKYLLDSLPEIENETKLGDWTDETNKILNQLGFEEILLKRGYKNKKMKDIIKIKPQTRTDQNFYIGTIHSAKGRTFDALMLVLKRKDGKNRLYTRLLENPDIQKDEEIRNIYVAMSRPRKVLVIAVPEIDLEFWRRKFLND